MDTTNFRLLRNTLPSLCWVMGVLQFETFGVPYSLVYSLELFASHQLRNQSDTIRDSYYTMAPTQDDEIPDLHQYSDLIDTDTFEQILEMDEDEDDRDFSRGIVYGFFEQAESTFHNMDKAFAEKNFDDLSSLGHFLKGSSATLGLTKVKDACEKIQHCKEELPDGDSEKDKAIDGIEKTLKEGKSDYEEVASILKRFFGDTGESEKEKDKKEPESPESD
ncbi:osomolarity two-component system, phosphorelay intermediate protein YPD1 [Talaromyces islandicus]|uniref:Osomolarity two-component system, phosphorelay intermediate protein YPD1 n=1 Tax=Talaromyces islandicus TaxID=28573 RepID=A0A0U1M9M5_TALIS|nr:osomolarity two-component system, phosphorelay intermediate protein YPD1 [Talaromyces islandicus]